VSTLQDRLRDKLDSATALARIDTFGQPQAGRQTAHVVRDVTDEPEYQNYEIALRMKRER